MNVKIKKLHPNAVIPFYSKSGDAGMDLTATTKAFDKNRSIVYGTGLAFEIPQGYVGLVFPRSSNSKKELLLTNHVGVIDSGYRGEVMLKFAQYDSASSSRKFSTELSYNIGDRIGQLIIMPYPLIEFEEVSELSVTERGCGGYGSTGQ